MARKPTRDFDLIVLGSGAGGSVAADLVASAGRKVAIVENEAFGGECPNWGCVPTRALLHAAHTLDTARSDGPALGLRTNTISYNYPSVVAWKDHVVKRSGVASSAEYYKNKGITLYKGEAFFMGPHEITVENRHFTADTFLIATGTHWDMPRINGMETTDILTSRTALSLSRPPRTLFIIGGGGVACEFAEYFSVFGTKVIMSETTARLLPEEDQEVSEAVAATFKNKRHIAILAHTKVVGVAKDGIMTRVTYLSGGEEHSVKVEAVMIADERLPNTDIGLENAGVEYTHKGISVNQFLQTSVPHIYAAGDVLGAHFSAHVGVYESRTVAENLLSRKPRSVAEYKAVPRVIFLSPEVASVGLSEAQCLRKDLPVQKGFAKLETVTRANTDNFHAGFVKVIADKKGQLLGASIVAPGAGELIHELTLAIRYGMSAADITNTLHAFPTWSEAIRVACAQIKQ